MSDIGVTGRTIAPTKATLVEALGQSYPQGNISCCALTGELCMGPCASFQGEGMLDFFRPEEPALNERTPSSAGLHLEW